MGKFAAIVLVQNFLNSIQLQRPDPPTHIYINEREHVSLTKITFQIT